MACHPHNGPFCRVSRPLSDSSEEIQTIAADWALLSRGMQHPAGDNREWRKSRLSCRNLSMAPENGKIIVDWEDELLQV